MVGILRVVAEVGLYVAAEDVAPHPQVLFLKRVAALASLRAPIDDSDSVDAAVVDAKISACIEVLLTPRSLSPRATTWHVVALFPLRQVRSVHFCGCFCCRVSLVVLELGSCCRFNTAWSWMTWTPC